MRFIDTDAFYPPYYYSAEVTRPCALQPQQHFGARCVFKRLPNSFVFHIFAKFIKNHQTHYHFLRCSTFLVVVRLFKQRSTIHKSQFSKISKSSFSFLGKIPQIKIYIFGISIISFFFWIIHISIFWSHTLGSLS